MQCFVYHSSLAETREGSTSEQSFSTSNEKKSLTDSITFLSSLLFG